MTVLSKDISLRQFEPGDEGLFKKLNEEWIERHFVVEEKDLASFADPQKKIIDQGGRIVFAIRNGEAVGCCALVAIGAGEYEVAKMAVTAAAQGAGIGRYLLEQVIETARTLNAARLYLETNRKLEAAVRLYESAGFQHLPAERIVKSPYARADVYMERWLR